MKFYKIVFALLISSNSFAQKQFVEVKEDAIRTEQAGNLARIVIPFEVEEGYYIQDFAEVVGNVLPTNFTVDDNSAFEKIEQELTAQNFDFVKLDRVTHKVIRGGFEIDVIVRLKEYSQYQETLKGELFYQTCNSRKCFFPRTLKFEIPLNNEK